MKASEWIDSLRTAKGWDSDYRVSKELDLSRQTVSKYRSGASTTMDEDTALKVAAALGHPAEAVLLDQAMERSKNEEARTALAGLLQRLGWAPGAPAAPAKKGRKKSGLYIMLSTGHRTVMQAMADTLGGPLGFA